ncbi:MAG: FAD-binding oxidoreductase [Oscillochloridaceae bacterium umkhey_bin13]
MYLTELIAARLTRSPEANRVALALFPDVVQACAAVSAILAAGHLPTALEVMDATTMRAVNLAQGANLPEQAGAALIIEIDGVQEGLDADLAELVALCRDHSAFAIETATSPEAQERLWSARRSAFASFHTLAPSYYLVDTVVPRTRLPAMMAHVQQLSLQYGLPIANVFHAGDGNLHPLVLYDPADPDQVAKAHAITTAVLAQSITEGGAVSGEHGIGSEKQDFLAHLYGPAELAAQALVYAIFNPEDRLNPGKVFPRGIEPLALAATRQADAAGRAGGQKCEWLRSDAPDDRELRDAWHYRRSAVTHLSASGRNHEPGS